MTSDDHWWIKYQKHDTKSLKAGDPILMPNRAMIEDYIQRLPVGAASTVRDMRAKLATAHNAAITCPVTTNIHLTEILKEANQRHASPTTPVWRAVEPKATALKSAGVSPDWIVRHRESERG